MIQTPIQSPIGELFLIANSSALTSITHRKRAGVPLGENAISKKAAEQLKDYFAGKKVRFTVPLDPTGTPFQKRVWSELKKIPYGKTRSYKDIAREMGKPMAFRAVGSANGKNPLCVIIPCHRVIAADGSLGGYSGGLNKKKILLKIESIHGIREK